MTKLRAIAQPHGAGSVGREIQTALLDARWNTFRCAVAFAKASGVRHIAAPLHEFAKRNGNTTRMSIGISSQGTSLEGLQDLWRLLNGYGDLYVFHEGTGMQSSFHPKAFLFRNASEALVIVGSNNLTEGGLFTNHEISTVAELTLTAGSPDFTYLAQIEAALDAWQTPSDTCMPVDPPLLTSLYQQGDLPSEAALGVIRKQTRAALRKGSTTAAAAVPAVKFGGSGVPKAPPPSAFPSGIQAGPVKPTVPAPVTEDPGFFGHPFSGWTTPRAQGAKPYPMATPDPLVDIIVYDASGNVIQAKHSHLLNMVDYELKHEIRITMPDRLQDLIPQMSILIMAKDPTLDLDYLLEFHPPSSAKADALSPGLTETLPSGGANAGRRYGWSSS